jgi:aminopeptidase N
LGYLHHPLRVQESEKYILPSLELLQTIQTTGDIFFPKRWLDVTLSNYSSDSAVETVRTFLDERPDYNHQLKMKILQAADDLFRANTIKN